VLRPLLTAALDGALTAGMDALTGPIARGDADTVAAHLSALGASAAAERSLYLSMAQATADRAPRVASEGMLRTLSNARSLA